MRAVLPLGETVLRRGIEVLRRIELVRINDRILTSAGVLEPAELRTLDAIHLATAALFEDSLGGLISYDPRQLEAARSMGWSAVTPT